MTPQERELIDGLFQRLKAADTAPKDREAEDMINKRTVELPSAPYLLAQTVLVQEHALNSSAARMAQLESELAEARKTQGAPGSGTSFLGGLFGRGPWGAAQDRASQPSQAAPRPVQAQPAPQAAYAPPQAAAGSVPITSGSSGGGFLHSALATAAGVAGGALLYDGIRSLFFHNPGPFGSALGAGWGQPASGLNETTNIVNNYYGNDPNDPGAAGNDPSVSDASWSSSDGPDATQQDASVDDGSAADSGDSFDTADDFDSGADFGGRDTDIS
jgi:hypothetical protein